MGRALATVLLVSLVSCLAACGGSAAEEQAIEVTEVFLLGLKDSLWRVAYNRLSPALQQECGGDPNELGRRAIARFEARITDWHLRVESSYQTNIVLDGEAEREGRETVNLGIVGDTYGERWRIKIVEVDGLGLCST